MKKYLVKWREFVRTVDKHGNLISLQWLDRVKIIEEYPQNLSDKYLDNILNLMTPKDRERNYYYDLIPLS